MSLLLFYTSAYNILNFYTYFYYLRSQNTFHSLDQCELCESAIPKKATLEYELSLFILKGKFSCSAYIIH